LIYVCIFEYNNRAQKMIDVFTEQIEVLIKEGISNLYWYKGDLKKSFYRANVPETTTNNLFNIHFNGAFLFLWKVLLTNVCNHYLKGKI